MPPLLLLAIGLLGGCDFNLSSVAEVNPTHDAGANADEAPDATIAPGMTAEGPATPAMTRVDAGVAPSPDAGASTAAPAPTVASADACAPDLPPGGRDVTVTADGGLVELARWQTPAVRDRALGPVVQLGSRRAWILNRRYTDVNPMPVAAGTPVNEPLAAWDAVGDTGWITEPPSARGDPLLTLGSDDIAGMTGVEPVSLVAGERGGLLFGVRFAITNYEGVWVADLAEDGVSARNRRNLFGRDDPLFAYGAIRTRDHLTLYACNPKDLASPCFAARAPNGQEDRRDAYEVRTQDEHGNWTWTSDLTRGTALLNGVDKDLSIFFSPYLQRYVAVHGAPRSPGRASLVLHTAPAPEGPWTEQFALLLPQTPVWWPTHVRVQEALSDPCGKRLIVSYFFATQATNNVWRFPAAGETVLGAIELTRH